jgi:hypothetical protein
MGRHPSYGFSSSSPTAEGVERFLALEVPLPDGSQGLAARRGCGRAALASSVPIWHLQIRGGAGERGSSRNEGRFDHAHGPGLGRGRSGPPRRGRADTEKDSRMRIGITVCKDRAGNYIPCPPNIREQIGR